MRRLLPLLLLFGCDPDLTGRDIARIADEITGDDSQDDNKCLSEIDIGSISGNTDTTIIIDVDICTTDGREEAIEQALNFTCGTSGPSAIACTWSASTLTLVATSGASVVSTVCTSPCTVDPEFNAPAPRTWDMTLEDGAGATLAGPIPVTTQT